MELELENLLKQLNEYENDLENMWKDFNPNDYSLKLEVLAMKMSVIFYKYLIDCQEAFKQDIKVEFLYTLKQCLTGFSYILSIISLFKAPEVTLSASLSSIYLTIKTKKPKDEEYLLDDYYAEKLSKRLYDFIIRYGRKIDRIYEQIDIIEDKDVINNLDESNKQKQLLCNELMDFLRGNNDQLGILDENSVEFMSDIVKQNFELNENFTKYQSILEAKIEYDLLNDKIASLSKKDKKLERIIKYFG